ncbi:PREDICTED: uncharacterized protein LOC104763183 [Camelina sativa]|uniref:Uncharacterized protein LOC104763183 n=1 Tax=Camelina sativa TaxID=90675 RepID=A0ABM0XEU8_CAMSA|nr:PREDICTED: uncharacterized protein LOC104763183 [Camelina sativa]
MSSVLSYIGVGLRHTISPYDLSSGDNPGTLISKPLLCGPNYDEWDANLCLALKARKKFGFADGTIPQPTETSPDFEDWVANNALVVSWIKLTIDENLSSSLSHTDDSHELWEHIQKRFGVKNGQRVQRLKMDLANCRQKGLAIEAHYGKLTQLWRNLADYQRAKTMEEVRREREEDKLHQFLMGLDETVYGSVKSSLLSRVPLPSLEEPYNTVSQDEESKLLSRLHDERTDGVSFSVQIASRPPRSFLENRGSSVTCLDCGRVGHLAENCFQLIGYPHWWPDKTKLKSGNNFSKGNSSGNVTGRGPHTTAIGSMRSKRSDAAHVNHVAASTSGFTSGFGITASSLPVQQAPLTVSDRVGISGLTNDQWKLLVHMLEERKAPPTERLSGKVFIESWIIDTGASNHMTGTLEFLFDICDMAPVLIKLPDGRFTTATKHGRVSFGTELNLQYVYFVDGLQCHLISVSQLTRDRLCVVQDRITKMLIGVGKQQNGLYFFRGLDVAAAYKVDSVSVDVMHCRLGHPSSTSMEMLQFSDLSSSSGFDSQSCDVCIRARQTHDSFPLSNNKTSFPFELIHCDLWGPYRTTALCGSRYFLTILDDYSRVVWIYLLPSKSDAPHHFKNFLKLVETQFSAHVKTVHSDNGSEFVCLSNFFTEKGIIHETSCVGTPQQNRHVKRKSRHILNVARALMFHAHLPLKFWGYCALTAGYLINRTPTHCLTGWRVYNIETGVVSVSRNVIFNELEFPFAVSPSFPDLASADTPPHLVLDDEFLPVPPSLSRDGLPFPILRPNDPVSETHDLSAPYTPSLTPSSLNTSDPTSLDSVDSQLDSVSSSSLGLPELLGRGHRNKLPSVLLKDYVVPPLHSYSLVLSSAVLPAPVISAPLELLVVAPGSFESLPGGKRKKKSPTTLADYALTVLANPYPSTTPYPMDNYLGDFDENWRFAIQDEITTCEDTGTRTPDDLPPGKKALGCMWVFRLKFNADGTLQRYKARLVVLGNHQSEGLDYNETFTPVAKMVTVRIFLQQVASFNWEVHQMDVHNAFLHGDLDEEVYMKFPPGFQSSNPNKVLRLRKSLYGLKQAL